jgi:hypothetical protein
MMKRTVLVAALTGCLVVVWGNASQLVSGEPQAARPRQATPPPMDMTQFDKCAAPDSTCWPDAFPRPGATKVFENDRVIVWDQVFPDYEYMHKHTKAFFIIRVAQGVVKITTPDGKVVLRDQGETLPRIGSSYEAGHGPHSETSATVNTERARSFYIEFKNSEDKSKLVNGRYPK